MDRLPGIVLVSLIAAMLVHAAAEAEETEQNRMDIDACVILLHGMGRTQRSMATMARRLAGKGYGVKNLDYPSTEASIESLSAGIVAETVRHCRLARPIGFRFISLPIHWEEFLSGNTCKPIACRRVAGW
jgi:hypothetical protein